MTIGALSFGGLSALGIIFFLLSGVSLMECVRAVNEKMKAGLIAVMILVFIISEGIVLFLGTFCIHIDADVEYNNMQLLFLKSNVLVYIIVLLIIAAIEIYTWRRVSREIRKRPTPSSLQEGLDQLPDGLLLCTDEGMPLLVNRKMQDIMFNIFGEDSYGRVNAHMINEDNLLQRGIKVIDNESGYVIILGDKTVWNIKEFDMPSEKNAFVFHRSAGMKEVLAFDVTELYEKRKELEVRNEHLVKINSQIREYGKMLDESIREQEMLAAKVRLHDDVGRCLLALRAYLSNDNGDRKKLVELWKTTVSILKMESERIESDNRMTILDKAAAAVGVSIIYDGDIPKELENLCATAIHECLTNTVKHADGSKLFVLFDGDKDCFTFEITNDGKVPDVEIKETGGLHNLRRVVENEALIMEIESLPRFVLRIKSGETILDRMYT
ncbi:MAG: ATP-binding protein [Lachnospiraceae bacterium]|nr:ATP-binding protein [Lachnospiraceae bacterium]